MISEETLYSIVDKAKKYDEILKFQKNPIVCCTFCGKSQNEVKRIIAGPDRQFICDECIELCNEIIKDETKEQIEETE